MLTEIYKTAIGLGIFLFQILLCYCIGFYLGNYFGMFSEPPARHYFLTYLAGLMMLIMTIGILCGIFWLLCMCYSLGDYILAWWFNR